MNDPRELYTDGLTEALSEVLRKQEITSKSPGPILADVQALIDRIGEGLPTTSKYFVLPQGRLGDLNQRLTEPLKHRLKRPQLRSLPALMGLFLLLRGSGLAVGQTKPKRMLTIDPAMLRQWNSLNPTEQYMSLLESWLLTASWEAVGKRGSYGGGMQQEIVSVYMKLDDTITKPSDSQYELFYGLSDAVTLDLLHQFGWVRLTYESKVAEGKTARVQTIERLPFGDAMFAAACDLGISASRDAQLPRKTLKPFFPEWKRSLEVLEPDFQDGQYTLKLSLGNVWRRLVAPAETTLEEVADILLDAFGFDDDHAYQFEFRDRHGREVNAVHPSIRDAEAFADEIRLGDLPLGEGDAMTFLFDFGDSWLFKVLIEEVSEPTSRRSRPEITERSGTPPKQYDYDEDDDEYEDDGDDSWE
ncbi:MAG: plasmid pRiA4b ORF-3 family protein [Candidatus Paceibacterota bacterium]